MKLTRMLKWAHAGEIAAYHAYVGHAKSLRDPNQKVMLEKIMLEEQQHIALLRTMLFNLGSRPSPTLDLIFLAIGKTIGALCHVTGWYLPMKVAGLMEYIGCCSYTKLAAEARWMYEWQEIFLDMAQVESEHKKYFDEVLR